MNLGILGHRPAIDVAQNGREAINNYRFVGCQYTRVAENK